MNPLNSTESLLNLVGKRVGWWWRFTSSFGWMCIRDRIDTRKTIRYIFFHTFLLLLREQLLREKCCQGLCSVAKNWKCFQVVSFCVYCVFFCAKRTGNSNGLGEFYLEYFLVLASVFSLLSNVYRQIVVLVEQKLQWVECFSYGVVEFM